LGGFFGFIGCSRVLFESGFTNCGIMWVIVETKKNTAFTNQEVGKKVISDFIKAFSCSYSTTKESW